MNTINISGDNSDDEAFFKGWLENARFWVTFFNSAERRKQRGMVIISLYTFFLYFLGDVRDTLNPFGPVFTTAPYFWIHKFHREKNQEDYLVPVLADRRKGGEL